MWAHTHVHLYPIIGQFPVFEAIDTWTVVRPTHYGEHPARTDCAVLCILTEGDIPISSGEAMTVI